MYKKLTDWYETKKGALVFGLIVFATTMYYMPYFMNKPFNGDFEGDIQNKLVWTVKGECYFVRPLNQTDALLVRVKDCDKLEMAQKVIK